MNALAHGYLLINKLPVLELAVPPVVNSKNKCTISWKMKMMLHPSFDVKFIVAPA